MYKTAMITGATAGFGQAMARSFSKLGYKLILTGRRLERLEKLAMELATPVHIACFDVRSKVDLQQSLHQLPSEFHEVDVLINNAGLALGLEMADKADLQDWETMIDTNIKGLVYMTRALLPGMVERNRGHIINIGSIAGQWPYPGGNVYGATKAFVQQFSRNLRTDLFGTGVRVTNIEPGMAETEFSQVRFKGNKAKAQAVYEGCQPLSADDIATLVAMVATLPEHININALEVMPTTQSWAGLRTYRGADTDK
ncbi:MAG: SDR family oxidoreductase [Bdellovibrionales bacterium]|nr:SDR family oxidoreductase [Bdellovibrionales bacterium]